MGPARGLKHLSSALETRERGALVLDEQSGVRAHGGPPLGCEKGSPPLGAAWTALEQRSPTVVHGQHRWTVRSKRLTAVPERALRWVN